MLLPLVDGKSKRADGYHHFERVLDGRPLQLPEVKLTQMMTWFSI